MSPERPLLYSYWRSTAAYRVRIALNLKGIDYEYRAVDLVRDGGEQHGEDYRSLNPSGLVPTLVIDGQRLTQSLAICEYLEETRPEPGLLPANAARAAQVRGIAMDIACDLHPLNNLRVQQYLRREHQWDQPALQRWMEYWMRAGFAGVERKLAASGPPREYVAGDAPGLADLCIVAQVYNADRFGVDLGDYPRVRRIAAHCRELQPFRDAAPENQPDAPEKGRDR